MSKKVKVLVSVLVAVILLTVGVAVPTMAEEETTPAPEASTANTTSPDGLLARVAGILGIPQEELVNAFKQAQQEMREEACTRYLDKAVEEELITQEEADEIKEWWGERPEALDRQVLRARISQAVRSRQMIAVPSGWARLRTHRLAD